MPVNFDGHLGCRRAPSGPSDGGEVEKAGRLGLVCTPAVIGSAQTSRGVIWIAKPCERVSK
jgi:hypothetical protein